DKLAVAQKLAKMNRGSARKKPDVPKEASKEAVSPGSQPKEMTGEEPTPSEVKLSTAETPLMGAKPPASPAAGLKILQERTRFGRYEVVDKIAKGGMGVVFKVRHPGLD